jgi:hypothetical protein
MSQSLLARIRALKTSRLAAIEHTRGLRFCATIADILERIKAQDPGKPAADLIDRLFTGDGRRPTQP